MQVYRTLRVLTARPDAAACARVPHRLYGVLSAEEACSAARWRTMALEEIAEARAAGRRPILVGGTGLYVQALVYGLSEIPAIPPKVRAQARRALEAMGSHGLHVALGTIDPVMAGRLAPGDSQRLVRAWEVLHGTGRSLADWQAQGPALMPPPDLCFAIILVMPPRDALYAACDVRFLAMLDQDALDEVRALDAQGLDPGLPVMKALGVPELRGYLAGRCDIKTAVVQAQQATRRYAKRQVTWFRHQLTRRAGGRTVWSIITVNSYDYDDFGPKLDRFLRQYG